MAFPHSMPAFCAALAALAFLRGAFAAPQLKTQPEVIAGGELKAKVLAASEEGVHAFEATKRAMASVEGRDISADFIKFWTKYRKRALNAR